MPNSISGRRKKLTDLALLTGLLLVFVPAVMALQLKGTDVDLRGVKIKPAVGSLGLGLVLPEKKPNRDSKEEALSPTSIKLKHFKVYTNGTQVSIEWATGDELNNLGFNVYRVAKGKRELINISPIAGSSIKTSANMKATGEFYRWLDPNPKAGALYYLEDIDLNGRSRLHGPIAAEFKLFNSRPVNPLKQNNSPLLTEMTKVRNGVNQKAAVPSRDTPESLSRSTLSAETTQWQIAGQVAAKILVDETGWYRIRSIDLNSVKFDTDTDMTKWQLYTGGVEVPITVNNDASLEFYGQALDTQSADTRVYYLIIGDGPGLRVSTVDGGRSTNTEVASSFDHTVERKDRNLYISSIFNGELENWFGPLITSSADTLQDVTAHRVDTDGQARLSIKLQGLTSVPHQINVKFNDAELGVVDFTSRQNRTFEFDLPANLVNEGENRITLRSNLQSNDISLVDSVRLTYPRRYEAVDEMLRFSVPAGLAARYSGFSENQVSLYEIDANGQVGRRVLPSSDGRGAYRIAPANYDREMLAIADSRALQVSGMIRNVPSSWHASTNEADFVIIVPYSMYKWVDIIAVLRSNQGLQTEVVYIEDVYDEFGFGIHSPDAIRNFLERATTSWNVKPRYALLFGDSSFDPRNYLGQTDLDLIPTKLVDTQFLETASDAWLADFNGDDIEDIALGRMPVSNDAEAEIVIEKWLAYEFQQPTETRSNVLVADNGFQYYNQILDDNMPGEVEVTRIERSSMTDSQIHQQIVESLNANPNVVTYTGHGTTGLWASSNVFTLYDARDLQNTRLSLYLLMTCLNGFTHGATNSSIAEELLKSPTGGAALVWSSSGTTYPNTQFEMTETITNEVFSSTPGARIGDMLISAKQATLDPDVRATWHLSGDPTAIVK